MHTIRKWWVLSVLVVGVVGCNSQSDVSEISDLSALEDQVERQEGAADASSELTGKVQIDGSSTVYPISEAAANEFRKQFPAVHVTVGQSGTGGGFKRFTQGQTDISDASRPIKMDEFEQCKSARVSFIELPISYDGLTIAVHPENTWVDQLTVEQLHKIFSEKGAAKNWNDVNPAWPAQPIKIYAPGTDSGTFDYFVEVVLAKGESLRSDISVSEDDNVLVTGVSGEKDALGFFGAAYYFENSQVLRAVPIVNPETGTAVMPTSQTIESGEYAPFSRPLFIYVNEASLKRPEIKKFVGFYLDNAAKLSEQVGYVRLPNEVYDRARKLVEERTVGTHFLAPSGDPRPGALPDLFQPENLVQ